MHTKALLHKGFRWGGVSKMMFKKDVAKMPQIAQKPYEIRGLL